ncbi:hypothetical protein [Micromonospora sp. NPDC049204]|uniref:hypothetical protein n=1 Tax=Micromonospora sp. NPDC049204 TaxID=3154351 RepID=UPI00340AE616
MRRIYHPDHTADIRLLLRKLVIGGVVGLVLVSIFAVFPMYVLDDSSEAAAESNLIVWVVRLTWIFIALLSVVSMLSLASAGIGWIAYRRRRALAVTTVQKGIRVLEFQGLVVGVPGRGVYVREDIKP